MTKIEIVLQLTLKMLDKNLLQVDDISHVKENEIEKTNEFNAKQIADLYNRIYENIKM